MDVCEITETKKSREWKIRWVMVGVQTGIKQLVSYSVWGSDGQHQRYQDGQVKETPAVHPRPLPGLNSPFQHQGMPSYGDGPPEPRARQPHRWVPGARSPALLEPWAHCLDAVSFLLSRLEYKPLRAAAFLFSLFFHFIISFLPLYTELNTVMTHSKHTIHVVKRRSLDLNFPIGPPYPSVTLSLPRTFGVIFTSLFIRYF